MAGKQKAPFDRETVERVVREARWDGADEVVARRLIFRRDVWTRCESIALSLSAVLSRPVSASDVAVLALEAGLSETKGGAL